MRISIDVTRETTSVTQTAFDGDAVTYDCNAGCVLQRYESGEFVAVNEPSGFVHRGAPASYRIAVQSGPFPQVAWFDIAEAG